MNRIDTSRFYRSHVKQPKGRGGWMFEDKDGNIVVTHSGTYTEAKKVAQEYAKSNNTYLYVCP